MTIKKNDVFVKVMLKDNVKLKSTQLGRNLKEILSFQLKKKYEGICTHHGYILEGSISVQSYSAGKIIDISLNGDILYCVSYYAYICNPCIGGIIKCKTINKNKFGLLAISEIEIEEGYYTEIVPRSSISKSGYMLANSIGIIDNNYRGNLMIALTKICDYTPEIELPFKCCQLIIRKQISANLFEVKSNDFTETERNEGGFGSTSK